MFWRRKKNEDSGDTPPVKKPLQEYTPDQVADALMGYYADEDTSESTTQQADHTQPTAPAPAAREATQPQVPAPTGPVSTTSEAVMSAPVSTPDEPAAPAPSQTVAALMEALKAERAARAQIATAPMTTEPTITKPGPIEPEPSPAASDLALPGDIELHADIELHLDEPESPASTPDDLELEGPAFRQAAQTPATPPVETGPASKPASKVPGSEVAASKVPASQAAPEPPKPAKPPLLPLPVSNVDWPLEALRGVPLDAPSVAEALSPDWAANGLILQDSDTLRLAKNTILHVPLLLSSGSQELWVFVYPESTPAAAEHFTAVTQKANLVGAASVYLAPEPLPLTDSTPAAPLTSALRVALEPWPADRPFPEGDYALWWPSTEGEHLSTTEEGRLLTRIFTLQDEAASLVYGLLTEQLHWNHQPSDLLRRELPEQTQYLNVMDERGQPLLLSASQDKGIRLHPLRSPESEQMRRYWLEQSEQFFKVAVKLLLEAKQPLDTLWMDYETRPSQWWKAAQQVLDLRLDIGDDIKSIMIGHTAEERANEDKK